MPLTQGRVGKMPSMLPGSPLPPAQSEVQWSNWAGNQQCNASVHDVSSIDQLRAVLAGLKPGETIRASGGGSHPEAVDRGSFSYSPLVTNDGQHLVRMASMTKVQKGAGNTLVCEPGATTMQASQGAMQAG